MLRRLKVRGSDGKVDRPGELALRGFLRCIPLPSHSPQPYQRDPTDYCSTNPSARHQHPSSLHLPVRSFISLRCWFNVEAVFM